MLFFEGHVHIWDIHKVPFSLESWWRRLRLAKGARKAKGERGAPLHHRSSSDVDESRTYDGSFRLLGRFRVVSLTVTEP